MAFRYLEELFIGQQRGDPPFFPELGTKAFFMYDVALANPRYYLQQEHRSQDSSKTTTLVYQRECHRAGLPFRYIALEELPANLADWRGRDLLLDKSGCGMDQMLGGSTCDINVTKEPRAGVIVSSHDRDDVLACLDRVRKSIAWAQEEAWVCEEV